jgi:hypothetical protein
MNCVATIARHVELNQTTNNKRRTACCNNDGDLRGGGFPMLTATSVEARFIFDAMPSPFAWSAEEVGTPLTLMSKVNCVQSGNKYPVQISTLLKTSR